MSNVGKKSTQRKGSTSAGEVRRVCEAVENKDGKSVDVKWVQCDLCDHWCHINSVGLDEKNYKYPTKAKKANKPINAYSVVSVP